MFQEGHNKYKVTFLYKSNDFLQQFLKRHIKNIWKYIQTAWAIGNTSQN